MVCSMQEMRKCRNENIQCEYGICDECLVTQNPSALDESEDCECIPKEVREHFGISYERGKDED